jgi:NADH:quinone reductase (non-electrogenic)
MQASDRSITADAGPVPDVAGPPPSGRHRVAIVGAGFGGLFAAKALRCADVDVTVIDRTNHHLFQPLLYQMATGILAQGTSPPPIRDILRHQANLSVMFGDVEAIDLGAAASPSTRSACSARSAMTA